MARKHWTRPSTLYLSTFIFASFITLIMSASVIRRGLDLFSEKGNSFIALAGESVFVWVTLCRQTDVCKEWCYVLVSVDGVKRKQKKSSCRKSALMEQISSDKQGVQRRIRRLQRPGGSARSTNTVKDKHIRSALGESDLLKPAQNLSNLLRLPLNSSNQFKPTWDLIRLSKNSSNLLLNSPNRRKPT